MEKGKKQYNLFKQRQTELEARISELTAALDAAQQAAAVSANTAEDVEQLHAQADTAAAPAAALEAAAAAKDEQLEAMAEALAAAREEAAVREVSLLAVQRQLDAALQHHRELQAETTAAEAARRAAEQQRNALAAEAAASLAASSSGGEELAAAHAEAAQLADQVAILKEQLAGMQRQAQAEAEAAGAALQQALAAREAQSEELVAVRQESTQLGAQVVALQGELAAVQQREAADVAQLNAAGEARDAELVAARQEAADLGAEVQRLRQQLAARHSEADGRCAGEEAQQAASAELAAAQAQAEDMAQQLAALRQELEDAKAARTAAAEAAADLRRQLAEAEERAVAAAAAAATSDSPAESSSSGPLKEQLEAANADIKAQLEAAQQRIALAEERLAAAAAAGSGEEADGAAVTADAAASAGQAQQVEELQDQVAVMQEALETAALRVRAVVPRGTAGGQRCIGAHLGALRRASLRRPWGFATRAALPHQPPCLAYCLPAQLHPLPGLPKPSTLHSCCPGPGALLQIQVAEERAEAAVGRAEAAEAEVGALRRQLAEAEGRLSLVDALEAEAERSRQRAEEAGQQVEELREQLRAAAERAQAEERAAASLRQEMQAAREAAAAASAAADQATAQRRAPLSLPPSPPRADSWLREQRCLPGQHEPDQLFPRCVSTAHSMPVCLWCSKQQQESGEVLKEAQEKLRQAEAALAAAAATQQAAEEALVAAQQREASAEECVAAAEARAAAAEEEAARWGRQPSSCRTRRRSSPCTHPLAHITALVAPSRQPTTPTDAQPCLPTWPAGPAPRTSSGGTSLRWSARRSAGRRRPCCGRWRLQRRPQRRLPPRCSAHSRRRSSWPLRWRPRSSAWPRRRQRPRRPWLRLWSPCSIGWQQRRRQRSDPSRLASWHALSSRRLRRGLRSWQPACRQRSRKPPTCETSLKQPLAAELPPRSMRTRWRRRWMHCDSSASSCRQLRSRRSKTLPKPRWLTAVETAACLPAMLVVLAAIRRRQGRSALPKGWQRQKSARRCCRLRRMPRRSWLQGWRCSKRGWRPWRSRTGS